MSNNSFVSGSVSGESGGVPDVLPEFVTVRPSDGERENRAPDGRTSGVSIQGTPPSNTVPSNDKNKHFKALRFGIDSLYVSYYGQLAEDWDKKLFGLKEKAQSDDEKEQALAQVTIGSHLFEVRDKGMPRFPYVLLDNCFFIKVNRGKSSKLPMAHIQISSEYLAAVGVESAVQDLDFIIIINTLGLVHGSATISRADLFLDFTCVDDLYAIRQPDWVTRANLMAMYFDCRLDDPFTGWVIGIGGDVHARLYEKVVEIKTKSRKTWLFPLWEANGWQGDEKVWRMEFQIEKEFLKQVLIFSLSNFLEFQAELWRYLTHDWLRLTIPSLTDKKRDRWPNHPLWDDIANVYLSPIDQPRLKRFRPERLPPDERIFIHGLGGLTSFMAREGIEDFCEGVGEFLHQATKYHKHSAGGLCGYVQRKVKAKSRKYNTINNRQNFVGDIQERDRKARDYRRVKEDE
ncbi:hypothetical protein SAMN05216302_1011127 [Nitrosomonas aestuarii]|uniref:Replication initiation factor n=1 Tax=Nitrosomonas aestuarii TaxID=52441 RepID=A0A1I4BCW9_9PROT|nr:hypothetical protein [Nitrosomonas aestuarii]SFK65919.1 hypothetical protein SAMN05216302_1011127 [Nitrosomonas aestuarii]